RPHAVELRFAVPEGGLYLWCQLPGDVRAADVQQHALRESIVFLPGAPFYVDRGGAHELRLCYTSQPPEMAPRVARTLAASIEACRRRPASTPSLMPIA